MSYNHRIHLVNTRRFDGLGDKILSLDGLDYCQTPNLYTQMARAKALELMPGGCSVVLESEVRDHWEPVMKL